MMIYATHLDLVHVADGVVELHRAPFLHVRLLRRVSVHVALGSRGRWRERCPWNGRVRDSRSILGSWDRSWLVGTAAVKGSGLTRTRARERRRRTANGDTEVCFWAFYAVLNLLWWLLLPATRTLATKWLPRPRGRLRRFRQSIASTANGMDSRTGRCGHSNAVWVILEAAFYPVPGREEGVEALDQVRMAGKQLRDSTNNSRSIDTVRNAISFATSKRKGDDTYVWLLKSFMMSRNLLYTSGCS